MICGLSCGFVGRGSERLLDRGAPVLTVADPCIWHGCGTNPSRRQSATTAGAHGRPGARMLRCTPTGLSHASGLCRRPEQS